MKTVRMAEGRARCWVLNSVVASLNQSWSHPSLDSLEGESILIPLVFQNQEEEHFMKDTGKYRKVIRVPTRVILVSRVIGNYGKHSKKH